MTAVGEVGIRRSERGGWRVLPLEVEEPRALLDEGVRLLESLDGDPTPTLRWYVSTRTAIVLGRGQAADLAAASTPDVTVLSRFSGGGAVLMDRELLSLDVLLPAGSPLLDGDLGAVFTRVGRAWAGALGDVGVRGAEIYEGAGTARRRGDAREQLLAAVCYATLGRGEVLVDGRKVVGLAQRRRKAGALVQCGLLRRWRPGPLLAALGADVHDAEIERAAVGLDDLQETRNHPRIPDEAVSAAVEARLDTLIGAGA